MLLRWTFCCTSEEEDEEAKATVLGESMDQRERVRRRLTTTSVGDLSPSTRRMFVADCRCFVSDWNLVTCHQPIIHLSSTMQLATMSHPAIVCNHWNLSQTRYPPLDVDVHTRKTASNLSRPNRSAFRSILCTIDYLVVCPMQLMALDKIK